MQRVALAGVLVLVLFAAPARVALADDPARAVSCIPEHRHCPHCCWCDPGHWEWRWERVLVEAGHYERVCLPPRGQWVREGAQLVWTGGGEPRSQWRWVEPSYRWRQVRAWVPGPWYCRPCDHRCDPVPLPFPR